MSDQLEHVAAEPTSENGWASWFCTTCQQHCASDNPCDHCDAPFGNDDEVWPKEYQSAKPEDAASRERIPTVSTCADPAGFARQDPAGDVP